MNGTHQCDFDGTFQVKQNPVVYDDPSADPNDQMDETSPEQEEATFSKMLRDRCTAGGWNTTILDRTPDIIWDYFLEENM